MKNTIEISNVGPIKNIKIELNTINVFMGAQSSGKSTIAKIISFCSWVEKNVATNQSLENYYTDKNFFIDRLETFHKMKGFFNNKSKISYESNVIKLEYSSKDFIINWVDKYAYKRNKISYIPAERSMVILPEIEKVEFPHNYLRSFLFDWFDARKQYSKENSLQLLDIGFDYYYYSENAKENHIKSIEKNNKHDILLSNASSGLQSITPMIAMVDYLTNFIYNDNQNYSYQLDEIRLRVTNELISDLLIEPIFKNVTTDNKERAKQIDEINKKLTSKDEDVTLLFNKFKEVRDNLFSTHSSNLIIEEPEQNLFPDTQRALIYYLLNKCSDNKTHQHQMTLTTHSPYILYAINNCIMAHTVNKKLNIYDNQKLKCKSSPINPSFISIYQIENGEIKCIQQQDGLIGQNYFDDKMKELMDDFLCYVKLLRMIKLNITNTYPQHISKHRCSNMNIYIADYTEHTRNQALKRSVEIFNQNPPNDIDYLHVDNSPSLNIAYIDFDNSSFIYSNGNPKSQCECVLFPDVSTNNSWIMFCELKYSYKPLNNEANLRKAMKQLFKTRYYYLQSSVFNITNTTYLIASLPLQSEPFPNFILSQTYLMNLKRKKNIVLRFKNKVEVIDDKLILV